MKRIIIITGYQSHWYDHLAKGYPWIQIIKNDYYATSEHMYSLYHVRDCLNEPFLLLESDLLYETRALNELLSFPRPNAILLSGTTTAGDEVYVETKGEYVHLISKDKEDLNGIAGVFVGISKISRAVFRSMCEYAEIFFQKSLYLCYEDCISMITDKTHVFFHKIDDLVWTEIDNPSHHFRAEQKIFPRLIELGDVEKFL